MAEKIETFLITVTVLEGRHYIWTNMDSAVVVKIGEQKKCTNVKRSTDSPLYGEYFVFEFVTQLETLLEKTVSVTVIQPRNACRRRKILGEFDLDVATIWAQKYRQFYHKWAILAKTDNLSGPRGYLKIDVSIIYKGQISEVHTNIVNDEIEGNLLLPDGFYGERQKAFYLFDVYKCENLVAKPTITINDNRSSTSPPNTFVEISFAAQKVRTCVKKSTHSPVFNERLTIMDLFPPLSQRIKIEICYSESYRKTINAARYLDLKLISNDREEGFLPTFGPTYLHMYFNNNLGGFAGKILVSMNTQLQEVLPTDAKMTGTIVQSIPPINEEYQFEDILLFGMLFGATAISKKCCDRVISFRMTYGSTLIQKSSPASGDAVLMNATASMKPKKVSKQYYYLPFESEKPCLVITRSLPACRKRMYNSNILSKIAKELKVRIKSIEEEFGKRNYRLSCSEVYDILIDTLDFIRTAGRKYIDIVQEYNFEYGTKLDKERQKMCLQEMTKILGKVEQICSGKTRKETLGRIQRLCNQIESLIFDVQDCWPDLHMWMIFGSRKVAYCRIPSKEILFSPIDEEKGEYCGKMRTICFYPHPKDHVNLSCKMDLMLWLGVDRHKYDCFDNIPNGYSFEKETVLLSRKIHAEEKYVLHLRAHVFQGKVRPGFDKTGLADVFVRVVIRDAQRETKAVNAKLNPLWDETLVLPHITLYGSKSYLQHNVPNVLIEVWDRDQCEKDDLIGRTLITPVIKFREDPYLPPKFPPKLSWHKTHLGAEVMGEILAAFEFIEVPLPDDDFQLPYGEKMYHIPEEIRPHMVPHRVEVLFWGVRDLRKVHCVQINRPRASVICEERTLISDTIENAKKNPNFVIKCKIMDVILPLEMELTPPLCIKLHDSRRFGIYSYAGVHISNVHSYLFHPTTLQERDRMLSTYSLVKAASVSSSIDAPKPKVVRFEKAMPLLKSTDYGTSWSKLSYKNLLKWNSEEQHYKFNGIINWFKKVTRLEKLKVNREKSVSSLGTYESLPQEEPESEDFDWWTKFYASQEGKLASEIDDRIEVHTLKIYKRELELQPEFSGFTDMVTYFEIYRGKRTGDEIVDEENISGIFKGSLKIYRWPLEEGEDYVTDRGLPLEGGMFQNYPDNLPVRFLLRVYCVQGLNLKPKDMSGKSDPYLCLTLNNKVINDREHYIPRQINPVFGRLFEFNGIFPNDHTLVISAWDFDRTSSDDLIGETKIDLENRFYTKHRAFCGIADHYTESGYCAWRGRQKPTAILLELCNTWGLQAPEYLADSVRIGVRLFLSENFTPSEDLQVDKEVLALTVLRRWAEMPVVGFPLVPEHVESRSLYHPSKPGIEQGKIQLWIDIFPITDLPPPRSVEITPRMPDKYELRVIIWNTEEVELTEDDFFLGERRSDIYVKGWLADSRNAQYTDIHYRSLTGEGNFNWRFVFPFEYLKTENKLVLRMKESIFAIDETEFKIPCRLTLQVWDNDTFSTGDFLGTLSLELSRMPRGAKISSKCKLSIMEPQAPTINLFKLKRTKGWWPFRRFDQKLGKDTLQGKVEVELEIVAFEEAEIAPAGLGRKEPQALSPPKRPDTSFSWFRSPLKALRYVLCKVHGRKICTVFFILLLIFMILAAIYAVPGYTIKRVLGAR